jgi:hypothetical protein
MNKIEKILAVTGLLAISTYLNVFSCDRLGITNNAIYYLIYSLIPYFIFGLFAAYVKNKPVIYLTAIFMLMIDYLMKFAIAPEASNNLTKFAYTWVLMTPLLLVSLLFIVLGLYITISWVCKKKGLSTSNISFGVPTKIQFDDEELGKFVFVVLAIGFLVNFNNIINLTTMILDTILGYSRIEAIAASGVLFTLFGMMPYLIFVLISYMVNSRGISYLVGFIAITFDIYLKIISQLFFNSGMEVGTDFSEVVNSVFNPVNISLFIPAAFAVLVFGKKLFEKK